MGPIKDLQDSLFARVAERVKQYGFDQRSKASYSFYRKRPFGRQAFHLSFIKHPADVDVTADVAIRFDELEGLVNKYKDFLTDAQKKGTFSLGAELGNVGEGRQKRWSVASFADVEDVADSITDYFVSIGIPYLEKYSDPEAALEALSGDGRDSWLHSPFHDERAMRAVGLAFMLDPKQRFMRVADAKTEFLSSRGDQGLQRFLRLRDELEHRLSDT